MIYICFTPSSLKIHQLVLYSHPIDAPLPFPPSFPPRSKHLQEIPPLHQISPEISPSIRIFSILSRNPHISQPSRRQNTKPHKWQYTNKCPHHSISRHISNVLFFIWWQRINCSKRIGRRGTTCCDGRR